MSRQLSGEDARQPMAAHAAAKGLEIRGRYGCRIGWQELLNLLEDRAFVRYPCEIVFDAGPLRPGEFACPAPKGARPEDGFVMHVHPLFQRDLDEVPLLVLYQLVSVNYGDFASAQDAEAFGAAALGLDPEEYYAAVCRMADRLESGI
ncbi:MAG: hypothetical protein ABSH34_27430 [Verrucomicrobiota bacterium]|jgi:hypothetical protein